MNSSERQLRNQIDSFPHSGCCLPNMTRKIDNEGHLKYKKENTFIQIGKKCIPLSSNDIKRQCQLWLLSILLILSTDYPD